MRLANGDTPPARGGDRTAAIPPTPLAARGESAHPSNWGIAAVVTALVALLLCLVLYAGLDRLVLTAARGRYPVVPSYPGAQQVQTRASRSDTKTVKWMRFTTPDPPGAVVDFYTQQFSRRDAGWRRDVTPRGNSWRWVHSYCPASELILTAHPPGAGPTIVELQLTQQSCRYDPLGEAP